MNYINLESIECCGCAACANICPRNAISMIENLEGFYTPLIDNSRCTDCGLCSKICPEFNRISKNSPTPECYAVMADDEIRAKSSSGGAFSVIAHEIFQRGGVVCGAAFDENWTVKHIIIDKENEINKLRGSKYVQSFISEDLYRKLKTYLETEHWVLFTGTPCQVAGFKAFLKKDYEKLLLVDLICSKVPPKKVFDKFLQDNFNKSEIKDIKFRDKSNGWTCSASRVTTTNNTTTQHSWFRMFLNSLSMNDSCVNCKYMSIDRIGDITIGDFWRIANFSKDLDDNKGTSLILTNTNKGKAFFCNLTWQKKRQMTCEQAIHGNRALLVPFIPHQNRTIFLDKIMNNNFNKAIEDLLSTKYNVGILNWWWNSNRGTILTCYAIQEVIKDLGYNPSVIKHIPYQYYTSEYQGGISEKFAKKYLNLTEWSHSRIDMRKLNEKFETFIVGSDQVWNHDLNYFLQDFYYLNFVELNKNKISCAASFGKPNFTGNNTMKEMAEYYFKRFNHISVREQDAVDLLKTKFNVEDTCILDPVFLIDKSKYENIIKDSKKTEKRFIACYFLNENSQKTQFLNEISKKLNLPIINIKVEGLPVEDWLYYIKNSEFVVSDSFHASCFSIIFNKPFLTLSKEKNSRFETLANITNIHNRFIRIRDFNIENLDELLKKENWEEIETKIKKEKEFSIQWLKDALNNNNNRNYSKEQQYIEAFLSSFDDRINYLEGELLNLQNLNIKYHNISLLLNSYKIKSFYYRYKILSKILVGKKRNHYKNKAHILHKKVREIRRIEKQAIL